MISSQIKILISGYRGKVGSELVKAVEASEDMALVGTADKADDLEAVIKCCQPNIVIDFTTPEAAFDNASIIIRSHVHPVIGTTGFLSDQIETLKHQCQSQNLGGIIAPNFSLGAVLMMRYAQEAARYFDHAEIIELHHATKKDAPSGTSIRTAERMRETWSAKGTEQVPDIPIHSVRLPGLVAHQMVMFGGMGETFTLRHDSTSRTAFVPGVLLACRRVMNLKTLVYGIESLLI